MPTNYGVSIPNSTGCTFFSGKVIDQLAFEPRIN